MKSMLSRAIVISCVLFGLLSTGISVNARNVSPTLHPNLAAAQVFIEKAINKLSAAQAANHFDMDGHAAKAKALLDQAYVEIKLAAKSANANR